MTYTNSKEQDDKMTRKQLRSYICSIQIIYQVIHHISTTVSAADAHNLLEEYAPSIPQLIHKWHSTLSINNDITSTTTASNNNDDDNNAQQKEVLPGDEIILLAIQRLHYDYNYHHSFSSQKDTTYLLLYAASLLEGAIHHSPYNPQLKIAAIQTYATLHAPSRSLELYDDLGIKHIQLDSCAYLILPTLLHGGLYAEAVQLCASIINLHSTTSKDVGNYAAKSYENGLFTKTKEMMEFQCCNMNCSLTLLQAKGVIMDCAALIYSGDDSTHKKKGASSLSPFSSSVLPLGAKHGICGGDYDLERATKMIHDSYNFFSAPSIMTIASSSSTTTSTTKDDYSDNRDSTIYDFEILHHSTSPRNQDKEQQPNYYITTKEEIIQDSLLRGHAHNLLVRATLILSVAKPPKKGKVTKPDSILLSRCESLLQSVQNANLFASASCDGSNEDNNESNQGKKKEKKEEQMIQLNMWNSMIGLCRIIAVLTIGEEDVKNNGDSNSNNATDAKTAT
eukprot:14783751-Ditylum_brightwellii.AAC.1